MSLPSVIVVCGPTASGKTALAEALASRFKASLISADSRQIYRGLDIGTAKPLGKSRTDWGMLDVVNPGESYSAGDYVRQATPLFTAAFASGRPVVIAGGTGLYLKSMLSGIAEIPPIPTDLRRDLEQEWRERGLAALATRLQELDPILAKRTDLLNPRRVLRALEVLAATGKPLSWWQAQPTSPPLKTRQLWLAPEQSAKTGERSIHARNLTAFNEGWVQEVAELRERWGVKALRETTAIGYPQILDHLDAKASLQQTQELIELRTRQYARRQRTWFKALPQVQWMPLEDSGAITSCVAGFLKEPQ